MRDLGEIQEVLSKEYDAVVVRRVYERIRLR